MQQQPESNLDVLRAVEDRYARSAAERESDLCCPVDYDPRYLAVLPPEILERDYGCGDPSRFVREGDVVLDLGSGSGKIAFIASQIAGPKGRVIGVDATPAMLALARSHAGSIGDRIGWHNVEFHRGHIQNLRLDFDRLDGFLARAPIASISDLARLEAERARLERAEPMIADESVDLVVSNCVLNLVAGRDKRALFAEIHRVLRRGGRCAISDIVSDEDVPVELTDDPALWSGCIAGALREDRFVDAFAEAGLYGVEIVARQAEPWGIVKGIEFRSMTVVAWKGKEGACKDHHEAVIYNGPWKRVVDDDGHVLERGVRTAVCRKTFAIYTRAPYAAHVTPVEPLVAVDPAEARDFDCSRDHRRAPAETKHGAARADVAPGTSCCEPGTCC